MLDLLVAIFTLIDTALTDDTEDSDDDSPRSNMNALTRRTGE